jgi:prepilin-type processing-associated H-X9-DG protein
VSYTVNKSAVSIAVWGPQDLGTGVVAPSTGPSADPTYAAQINRNLTGRQTNVAYCDGHVKMAPTTRLYSKGCVMDNGNWRGEALATATPAGNAGWCRDW